MLHHCHRASPRSFFWDFWWFQADVCHRWFSVQSMPDDDFAKDFTRRSYGLGLLLCCWDLYPKLFGRENIIAASQGGLQVLDRTTSPFAFGQRRGYPSGRWGRGWTLLKQWCCLSMTKFQQKARSDGRNQPPAKRWCRDISQFFSVFFSRVDRCLVVLLWSLKARLSFETSTSFGCKDQSVRADGLPTWMKSWIGCEDGVLHHVSYQEYQKANSRPAIDSV